ncbi:EAL domain-containing protein [Methylorubrum zatmanii]|uniref:EAL domain-containing protein n=1 Tax=Methylorubrum zatmanii TaxID=29429 RepID=A0ABW1WLC2_9HYPH|nr:EAL domain-containing protein [Methylorubrum zatmanii]MBD8908122.1 bifunctional diguanylate cyclase/phosphodiesterase [Methylorubrum zatmanii]
MTASCPVRSGNREAVLPARPGLLETGLQDHLDALCRSAAALFDVPIALIPLVDEDRFRFRARCGIDDDGIDRAGAFCNHTIRQRRGEILVVPDLTRDERFARSPLVVGEPRARFYAGVAVGSVAGRTIGTFCLMDRIPRFDFTPDKLRILQEFALIAEAHLQLYETRRASQAEISERSGEEARLVEWEARLRATEAAHAMVEDVACFGHWRIDATTDTIAWSEGVARIFGRNPELAALSVETHLGFYHPDDRERVLRSITDALAGRGGIQSGYEHRSRIVRPDGEERVIGVHGLAEYDDAGRLSSIFGVCLDVTDLTRSEQRLRDAGEVMRTTLEAMDQGLVMVGPDARIRLLNQRAHDLLDLPETLLHEGASWTAVRQVQVERGEYRLAPPEIRDWLEQGSGMPPIQRYERTRPDGTVLEVRLAPLPSGGLVCTYTDLTARRRSEAALRSAEADYQSLFQNAVIGVYRARLDGSIVQANRALARLHGYGGADELPLTDAGFSHDWYVEPGRHEVFLKLLGQKGHVEDFVSEVRRHAGGQRIWVSETAWAVRDAEGEPVWFEGTVADATERKRTQALIEHMARHDILTGLPNRRLFQEVLTREIWTVQRDGGGVAVLCCDLDRFKAVNDTFGHPAGDALLRVVARRFNEVLSEGDMVARLGGDEFAVILPCPDDPDRIVTIARRLIQAIDRPIDLDGRATTVGVSIGVAVGPRDGDSADTLFKNADIALYRAKDSGRNTFRFYESGMDQAVATRNLLEIDLRNAIRSSGFTLHYQPIFNLAEGVVRGFEALLRWDHPVRGPISPGEFIPVAEETGLIAQLGAWALNQACREAAAWPGELRVAVNVSAVQFRKAGLEQAVMRALANSGLPARRLELEITESVLMQDSDSVIDCLHRLRAMGVRIALDDFGTGYSSLSYLCRFPFDKIKIDRSFIREIDEPVAAAVVRAVVGLGERLGTTITAEGVETEEQLARIRNKGCTEAQGFLLGRPQSAEATRTLVARQRAA